ncbi:hypothetical protein ABT124_27345 [Streptomyces sp. NPDC001982]|uniref:hypothetical protein n=1 Tax=Streptomyces sp. NPDC001982 TaxID=3154405 RepID=UPI00332D2EB6
MPVFTVPTDAPEADGTLAWDSTTMVITEVTAGDMTGTGWTYGPASVGLLLSEHLAPLVEGHDAMDIPALHDAMCRAARNAGRPWVTACAISARTTSASSRCSSTAPWTPLGARSSRTRDPATA